MTLQEFSALKVGDKVSNPWLGSTGEVVETTNKGVNIVWGGRTAHEKQFFYSVVSTAWMGWSKIDDGGPGAMREMPYGA